MYKTLINTGSALWENITADGRDQSAKPNPSAKSVYRFHTLMVGLIIVLMIGGSIDGWYHVFYGFEIESFFILSHYLMYGAWLAILVSVAVYAGLQARKGSKIADWLPPRYALTALGAILFGISGGLDII